MAEGITGGWSACSSENGTWIQMILNTKFPKNFKTNFFEML